MKHTLILENLNCAHCASKIETAVAQTEGFSDVSFNFATKKLRFTHDSADVRADVQAICDGIEDGVRVRREEDAHGHAHHHEHRCDGHCHDHGDHGHAHEHEHGEANAVKKILLITAAVLAVAALALRLFFYGDVTHWVVFGLCLAAALADATVDLEIYDRRRKLMAEVLKEAGIEFEMPKGAFYFFVKSPVEDDSVFVDALLKQRILVVPGKGFGFAGYVRLSCSVDEAIIKRSADGFKRAMANFK